MWNLTHLYQIRIEIYVIPAIPVVLSMFNHHYKVLATSSHPPYGWLLSPNGSIIASLLPPSHLFTVCITICAFLKQVNRNQGFDYSLINCLLNPDCLFLQICISPFGFSVISTSKCPRPKSYPFPFS